MTTAPFVAARGQSKVRPFERAAVAGWTSASRPGAPAISAAPGRTVTGWALAPAIRMIRPPRSVHRHGPPSPQRVPGGGFFVVSRA